MRTLLAVAVTVAASALVTATPAAADLGRPTLRQAHVAAHLTMDMYASTIEGKFIVGPCAKRGVHSQVCRTKVVGKYPTQRFRMVITLQPKIYWIVARPLNASGAIDPIGGAASRS